MLKQDTISLDIGTYETKMAAVQYEKGFITPYAFGNMRTDIDYFNNVDAEVVRQKLATDIIQLMEGINIVARRAHVVLPDSHSYAQVITMPILSEEDLLKSIRYQADEIIPTSIDDVYLDLAVIHKNDEKNLLSILMVAVQKNLVDAVYRTLEFSGLEAHILETEISAYSRLVTNIMHKKPVYGYFGVVNLGWETSSLYVYDGATNNLITHKRVKSGLFIFLQSVSLNLNISIPEATTLLQKSQLTADITKSLLGPLQEMLQDVVLVDKHLEQLSGKHLSYLFFANYVYMLPGIVELTEKVLKRTCSMLPIETVCQKNTVYHTFENEVASFAAALSAGTEI